MKIYELQELKKPNFIQKIFGWVPKLNGFIEINNLFFKHQTDIKKISLDDIIDIAEKYKINLKKKFKSNRLELFQKYLHYCLIDSKLEDAEIMSLKHIKEVLLLNEKDTQEILKSETENIYQKHVKEIVADGRLDDDEKEKLEKLKKDLLISDEIASKIYERNATDLLQSFITGAISDERLSPDEEVEIKEIAKSLNIDLEDVEQTKEELDRYKLYWQIENGELPTIEPDIKIQKSEKLYFETYVNWLEQRRVTKKIKYGGATARIKIAKGVYYKIGSVGVQSVSEDVLKKIDFGALYLTNKRLIFMGSKANKTIRLDKILDFTPYENGVDIQKETGKNPFLEFTDNVDLFSMILVRLLDE